MPDPEGTLTALQYQMLQVVWEHDAGGVTATEIWEEISEERDVGRTTVLKQIQRLEARRWLQRTGKPGVARYVSTVDRAGATRMLAGEFVDDYFDGSLSDLVMSVLGSRKFKRREVDKLRQIIDEHNSRRK